MGAPQQVPQPEGVGETNQTQKPNTDRHKAKPNRLAQEKSPYLLQHAYNPVNWYPWGEEAFEEARRQDKPIFLSIGYSTCHWCHVMERESFEDEQVAQLMNDAFVSIKVDREERADIDNVYMTVCQMMTGSGGWPLTILMTPDKQPFFAATYIPKTGRFGSAGMLDLIPRIHDLWTQDREKLLGIGGQVVAALSASTEAPAGGQIGAATSQQAYEDFSQRYDSSRGGFGRAPKFPTPHNLTFLLRYWRRGGDERALQMVTGTLKAMRAGGIYDHVGYGFHRYSTDRQWLVPHFEKMLYDQALLTIAFTETWQATGETQFRDTAEEIIEYVRRDMTSPQGAFYSAEDADSEGEEGKFYVWSYDELISALGEEDGKLFARVYGASPGGNFADEASGQASHGNILHLPRPVNDVAEAMKIAPADLSERLENCRGKLLELRSKRVRPLRDDKVLTDWNGLMIASLSIAARAFEEPRYAAVAQTAASFILDNMQAQDGRLLHRFRDDEAAVDGNLDDYAFLVWGLIELYEATFDVRWFEAAVELNQTMLTHFSDDQSGSLYFTADDAETILTRRKETYDGAVPSGNSVAASNLLRLARMTGEAGLEQRADGLMSALSGPANSMPAAHTQLLVASEFVLGAPVDIVLAGSPDAPDTREMLRAIFGGFHPAKSVMLKTPENAERLAKIAEHTEPIAMIDGKATAYVCRGNRCEQPTTDPSEVQRMIREGIE